MTNKEAYEKAVGMSIDPIFFIVKNIDPYEEFDPIHDKLRLKPIVSRKGDWLIYHSYDFKFECYVLKGER